MQGLLRNKGRQQVRQRLLSNQKSPGDEMAKAGLELTRITHTAVSGKLVSVSLLSWHCLS